MRTIIFQGDSITDADRNKDCDEKLGMGYPLLVTGKLGFDRPGEFNFLNYGESGDRVVDLYARIKMDVINLHPDVLSVLIGVNDVWHELNEQNGVDAEKYRTIYSMFIEEIQAACPGIKILILEPFLLPGPATDSVWDVFRTGVGQRAAISKAIAAQYGLTFVPLQHVFDAALEKAPASYWTADGVHPTTFGHELIAREWLRAFDTLDI